MCAVCVIRERRGGSSYRGGSGSRGSRRRYDDSGRVSQLHVIGQGLNEMIDFLICVIKIAATIC
jgi:hypothetical protein